MPLEDILSEHCNAEKIRDAPSGNRTYNLLLADFVTCTLPIRIPIEALTLVGFSSVKFQTLINILSLNFARLLFREFETDIFRGTAQISRF